MTGFKIQQGTQVRHKCNPQWRGVVVQDLNPSWPVNGFLMVRHLAGNGHTVLCKMAKSLMVELPLPKDFKNCH